MRAARERMKYIKHAARELISYVMHAAREMILENPKKMKLLYICGKKIFYGFFLLEKKILLMPFIFRKDNLKMLLMPFRKENFF